MAAWSGTLPFRQQRAFTHLADLWEPDFPLSADGGEDTTYSLVLSAVPALRSAASSIDNPQVLALIESAGLDTVDAWRLPVGVEVNSSWFLIDRTLNPDGSEGLQYDRGWKTLGEPVQDEDWSATKRSGCVDIYASRVTVLPATLRTHYGLPEPGA